MIKGVIAQSVLAMLTAFSVYNVFRVNFYYITGGYLKWLNVILLIVTLYGLVLFFSGIALYPDEFNINTSFHYGYLKRIYLSVLPIYTFYLFSLNGYFTEKNMLYIFLIILVLSVFIYYEKFFLVSEQMEREEVTNNIGYRFVPLIPMLGLVKMKEVWKYVFLIVIAAFIMMSMKRGAILIGTVALLMYLKHHLKTNSIKQYVYILLLTIITLCVIYWFVVHLYETSSYFRVRINNTLEGNSSGRDSMYMSYFDFFLHHTSAFEFLFGSGANATYLRLGNYAHNDWLEFAINQGVLGLILYIFYWITFAHEWKNSQSKSCCKLVLGDIIIIYFLKSFFSMSFDGMTIAATLCIGHCLAQASGKPQIIRNEFQFH